ncbi:MAG: ABC transporter ATP-binding protein [Planctomycetota bacterium]|nr:MAG: ABC transporter ATP-binding protein [Planctomycetota bacterium]
MTQKLKAPIQIHNLSVGFPLCQPLLTGLNFSLQPGEKLAILGPNGVGKTTLLKTIAGLHPPLAGEIKWPFPLPEKPRYLAYLPQKMTPPRGFTLLEIVFMGRYPLKKGIPRKDKQDMEKVERVLQKLQLWDLRHREGCQLSGGEQSLMFLAQLLVQEADYLLLDEPFSHLDMKHQVQILDILEELKQEGKAICLTLHLLNLASKMDRILLLGKGKTVDWGSSKEVLVPQKLGEAFELNPEQVHLFFNP